MTDLCTDYVGIERDYGKRKINLFVFFVRLTDFVDIGRDVRGGAGEHTVDGEQVQDKLLQFGHHHQQLQRRRFFLQEI